MTQYRPTVISAIPGPNRQRGSVAVIVALSAAALIALAGLGMDAGRLYINTTELQSSADACALAAVSQLVCNAGTCTALHLQRATSAGTFLAGLHKRDFQLNAATIANNDVQFSLTLAPNSGYLSAAGGAPVNSKFAMCIARANGLLPWFMRMVGSGAQNVTATGVATLAPSATNGVCPSVPMGACPKAGGGTYAVGDWLAANATGGGNNTNLNSDTGLSTLLKGGPYPAGSIKGTFTWVDFSYPGGGTDEVRSRLVGAGATCGVSIASTDIAEEGVKQGAKDAYDSRFGIYGNGAGSYTKLTAPPDRTGYAYPTTGAGAIAVGASAYADFVTRQASGAIFQGTGGGSNYDSNLVSQGNAQVQNQNGATQADHLAYGGNRRLIAIPIVDGCTGASHAVTIQSWACFLILNPMANGANADVFMEYRGDASLAGSPCATIGVPAGPGSTGPLVPALVQ
jgi:hypothetical protein